MLPHNADFIRVLDQLRINREPARRVEHVCPAHFLLRDGLAVHDQLIFQVRLKFAAHAQVIVHRQHHDGGVARVAPLRATPILDQPVRDRLDEFVLRINRKQRAQCERRRLHAAVRPAPVNAVLAPMCCSHHARVGWCRAADEHRSIRAIVAFHTILKISDQDLRFVGVVKVMRAQGEQRAGVSVERFALGPEIIEGFGNRHARELIYERRVVRT